MFKTNLKSVRAVRFRERPDGDIHFLLELPEGLLLSGCVLTRRGGHPFLLLPQTYLRNSKDEPTSIQVIMFCTDRVRKRLTKRVLECLEEDRRESARLAEEDRKILASQPPSQPPDPRV